MKLPLILLALLALVSTGIIHVNYHSAPNPNDILRQVHFYPLNPLAYAQPEVEVDTAIIHHGHHGRAYKLVTVLYPLYAPYPVYRCRYSQLGLVRYYTFSFQIQGQTRDAKTAIEVEEQEVAVHTLSHDGYYPVSIEWAQEDPRISRALDIVIRRHFTVIGGRPLRRCESKPVRGVHIYRFYFTGVDQVFIYDETADDVEVYEGQKSFVVDNAPIFSVNSTTEDYVNFLASEYEKHPAFEKVNELLQKELGGFDTNWIVKFKGAKIEQGENIQLTIRFKPFLLEQHYEAYYYGNIEKASLLKVDEKVFNDGTSYENWQNIENFQQYNAFKQANEYTHYHFPWLRFYTIEAAYSALHKRGRFIRLVYKGIAEQNIDPGQQINMVIYIDQTGKYFMDRNDFHATHLNSAGRNDWISLFVATPDVTQAKYYQRIVKFIQRFYPKYWGPDNLVDIRFKDDLHVIKLRNPTNERYAVLAINEEDTTLLNKIEWVKLADDSPLFDRLEKYVRAKYSDCARIMFIHYFKADDGTHLEISYLDHNNEYKAVYVLYIEETDVFTDDTTYRFKAMSYGKYPLPQDIRSSINTYLIEHDSTILAVSGFLSLSPTSYAIIGISETGRWQITVEWQDGKWVVVSKQPYNGGYFKARGYPSSAVASCTGFLKKLYPKQFGEGYVYVSIETKTVGMNIYSKLTYRFRGIFVEAVVKYTFGVENSHVLYSWKVISGLQHREDYGYGVRYVYSYGVPKRLFYQDQPPSTAAPHPPKVEIAEKPAPVEPTAAHECPRGTRREMFTHQCMVVF